MARNPKRRHKWGHYLKKGLELGALGAVQFVPGLDVVADAAVAGEAVAGAATAAEGVEAVTGAVEAGEAVAGAAEDASALSKGMRLYNKASGYYDKASGYYDKYQEYKGYYDQFTGGGGYRKPAQVSYRGQPPAAVAAAYRVPPKHHLGPMQKKMLIFGIIFVVVLIIIAILAKSFVKSYNGCSKSI